MKHRYVKIQTFSWQSVFHKKWAIIFGLLVSLQITLAYPFYIHSSKCYVMHNNHPHCIGAIIYFFSVNENQPRESNCFLRIRGLHGKIWRNDSPISSFCLQMASYLIVQDHQFKSKSSHFFLGGGGKNTVHWPHYGDKVLVGAGTERERLSYRHQSRAEGYYVSTLQYDGNIVITIIPWLHNECQASHCENIMA